jgi:hypothetical protein
MLSIAVRLDFSSSIPMADAPMEVCWAWIFIRFAGCSHRIQTISVTVSMFNLLGMKGLSRIVERTAH